MSGIRISAPKTASIGEIVELKAMIKHPMESGYRRGPRGERIERDIIKHFQCEYNGNVIFDAEFFPAIAANPFLSFYLKAEVSGTLLFRWTDQHGKISEESRELVVT